MNTQLYIIYYSISQGGYIFFYSFLPLLICFIDNWQFVSFRFGEIVVLILFIILALLWISRDLPDVGGWSDVFLDEEG